jgi:hypothetical protein
VRNAVILPGKGELQEKKETFAVLKNLNDENSMLKMENTKF